MIFSSFTKTMALRSNLAFRVVPLIFLGFLASPASVQQARPEQPGDEGPEGQKPKTKKPESELVDADQHESDRSVLGKVDVSKVEKIGRIHDNIRRARQHTPLYPEAKEIYRVYSGFKNRLDKDMGLSWSVDLSYLPQWAWVPRWLASNSKYPVEYGFMPIGRTIEELGWSHSSDADVLTSLMYGDQVGYRADG